MRHDKISINSFDFNARADDETEKAAQTESSRESKAKVVEREINIHLNKATVSRVAALSKKSDSIFHGCTFNKYY